MWWILKTPVQLLSLIHIYIDTIVLGCTHYPWIQKNIARIYPDLHIINPSSIIVDTIREIIQERDMAAKGSSFENIFYASDLSENFVNIDVYKRQECAKILTSLGQIVIIWVGGGTVIPWAVIPVSAICGVSPRELAKKNLIPVACGLVGTIVCAVILMAAV